MSVSICQTVTTDDPDVYRAHMEEIATYATRVHIDLGDGIFTRKLTAVEDVWWPGGMRAAPVRGLCQRQVAALGGGEEYVEEAARQRDAGRHGSAGSALHR